ELLAAEDSESPCAYIWVPKKSKSNIDYDTARIAVDAAAKELLVPEELKNTTSEQSGEVLLWLPAPSKRELLDLLSDGDGRGLVELFVSQFDLMARFVPVLDKLFRDCVRKE